MTPTTTRTEYVKTLNAHIALLASHGNRNPAIEAHLSKVLAMTDEAWPAHRQTILDIHTRALPAVKRMVRNIPRN